MNTPNIPTGYRQDAQGRLIPEETIKPIDLMRDQLVNELVDSARAAQTDLKAYKRRVFVDIAAFVDLSAEQYDVKLGGQKGNVQLLSFDGRYKIVRQIQDTITFDERLQASKKLIDECLRDWTEGARVEVAALINDAFRVDQAGNIRTAMVLSLRRLKITDARWKRAMEAISDAVQVTGSKAYVRFYERVGDSDQYTPISLDMARI
jgi:hypothetical protein